MDNERGDRRVRRTRRALHEALRSLILQKGYDNITVQDVLDRADVGRATFYAHFRDKDELLMSGFAEMRESLRQHLRAVLRAEDSQADEELGVARALFEHAAGHRKEYRALVGSRSGGTILKFAHKELTSLMREQLDEAAARRRLKPKIPVDITALYTTGALLALLGWWLDNEGSYTAEQMGRIFERLTRPAVAAALDTSR